MMKNRYIPRLLFYVLHSKCNCIQHFKLHKNWNWAIQYLNVNLMLNLKCVKIIVGKKNNV